MTDPSDPAAGLYDEELTLLLADVFESTTGDEQLAELRGGAHSMAACPGLDLSDVPWGGVEVRRWLGCCCWGRNRCRLPATQASAGAERAGNSSWTRPCISSLALAQVNGRSFATTGAAAVLRVKSGRRYRVRALSGASSWALRLAVAGHNVSVVAVDGAPIAPAPAASFVLASGQRADFILTADQPPANYWVNVSSLNGHVAPAILHYEDGAPDPATDPAVAPTAYEPRVGCPADPAAAAAADLDLAAVQAGVGVEAPPQVGEDAWMRGDRCLLRGEEGDCQRPGMCPAALSDAPTSHLLS